MDDETRRLIQSTHDQVTGLVPVVKAIHEEQAIQGEQIRQLELNERGMSVKQAQLEAEIEDVDKKVVHVDNKVDDYKDEQLAYSADKFWKLATLVLGIGGFLLGVGHLAVAYVSK